MKPACRATAAAAAGVSRVTAYRWLKQPAFKDELTRQREAVLSEALDRVKTQAAQAAVELGGLLRVKDDRLRRLVCNDILERAMKIHEMQDLENRLTALEKAMEERKHRRDA